MADEIDYLMESNESGVIVWQDANSQLNRIREWLDTPMGTVYGWPDWGNELAQFKHEPTKSDYTAVNIEFAVLTGIARDLPGIVVQQIRCDEAEDEIDEYVITIGTQYGIVSQVI